MAVGDAHVFPGHEEMTAPAFENNFHNLFIKLHS